MAGYFLLNGNIPITRGLRRLKWIMITTPASAEPAFTICIVDEDESVRSGLAALLSPLDAVIRTFGSAEALLDSLEDARPDCLITELSLPGLEGRQLHRELSKRGFRVPVIYLARNGNVREAVEAMRAGATDFIEKPFIDKSLVERVRSIIDARHDREHRGPAHASD